MIRRPTRFKLTAPLFPVPTLFRSPPCGGIGPQREQEQFGGVPERRPPIVPEPAPVRHFEAPVERRGGGDAFVSEQWRRKLGRRGCRDGGHEAIPGPAAAARRVCAVPRPASFRSEEHTSELQSLMRSSYADFCLTNKKIWY